MKQQEKIGIRGLMERHNRISLRRPESISLHCKLGFSREAVATFYEKLHSKIHFPAGRVYNIDETDLLNVQQKWLKVMSPNGAKQLGATTLEERG